MPKSILYAKSFLRSGCLGLLLICAGLTGHANPITPFHVISVTILAVIWIVSVLMIGRLKYDTGNESSFTSDKDAWVIVGFILTAFILLTSIISLLFRINISLDGFHCLTAAGIILFIQNSTCILLEWYRNLT